MRRTTLALSAAAVVSALAFAPVTIAEEDGAEFVNLTAATDGSVISGTLEFGGTGLRGTDPAGDSQAPGGGFDIGDVTIEQKGALLVVRLSVLDSFQGEVAPITQYRVDLPNSKSLLAYRGSTPDDFDYQLADFSSGYTSGPAEGSWDGSTVEWTIPNSFGKGTSISGPYGVSVGISPAECAATCLNGSASGTYVDGGTSKSWRTGGEVNITIAVPGGNDIEFDVDAATADGTWSFDTAALGLAPGTYTVTVSSDYGTLRAKDTAIETTLVVEEPAA